MAGVHFTGNTVSSTSSSVCSLAPLGDSSSFSSSWSSPSGPSGTSCPYQLLSTPCDNLVRFCFWSVSTHFFYQLCNRVAISSIPDNTSYTGRVLWLTVSICSLKQLSNVLHHQHDSPHHKITSLLTTFDGWGLWI